MLVSLPLASPILVSLPLASPMLVSKELGEVCGEALDIETGLVFDEPDSEEEMTGGGSR